MSDRKLVVATAQGWFDSTRDSSYSMGDRLLFMENALNHTENALVAVRQENTDLRTMLEAAQETRDAWFKSPDQDRYTDLYHGILKIDKILAKYRGEAG